MGKTGLAESFDQLIDYFQYELPLDAKYFLFQVLAPLLIGGLVLHGSVGLLSAIYKLFVPPSAEDLHLSALAALHKKRTKREDEVDQQEAEKLWIKALARDDLYFPSYLSLASLYIYRMKQPDKALEILEQAKDRGPLQKLEALIVDAQALKTGNDHMIRAGGALFYEHDYLQVNEYFQVHHS